jgi:hypothetical protein
MLKSCIARPQLFVQEIDACSDERGGGQVPSDGPSLAKLPNTPFHSDRVPPQSEERHTTGSSFCRRIAVARDLAPENLFTEELLGRASFAFENFQIIPPRLPWQSYYCRKLQPKESVLE